MSGGDVVVDLLWNGKVIVGGIDGRGGTGEINEANGDEGAFGLSAGGKVDVVEVTCGLQHFLIRFAVGAIGDQLGPAADAIGLCAAVIATGGHARRQVSHPFIKAGGGESLESPLAAAIDNDGLAVPLRLRGEEVNGANCPQKHAEEVTRLPRPTACIP